MFTKIRELRDECPLCEGVRDLDYGSKKEVIRVRGEGIDVESKLYYCKSGDHYFQSFEDDEERIQSAYREYRKRKGLLQPEEIRQIREKYGLSQRALARLLNWGLITIQRYEAGAIQDPVHNDLLFLLSDRYSFRRYFESKKNAIPERIRRTIESGLKDLDSQLNFIFEQIRAKNEEICSEELVPAKLGQNIGTLKVLAKAFSCCGYKEVSSKQIRIINNAKLSSWQTADKKTINKRNLLPTGEGELAIAA